MIPVLDSQKTLRVDVVTSSSTSVRPISFGRDTTWQTSDAIVPSTMIVTRLDPPFQLVKPIEVSVEEGENESVAGYIDADIYMSGDNFYQAIDNLKSMIMDLFDDLTEQDEGNLGPVLRNQRAVLRAAIRKQPGA